jgi:hypothetical protein
MTSFYLERISHVVDRFESCGDYTKGIACIQFTNPLSGSHACAVGALNVERSSFVLFLQGLLPLGRATAPPLPVLRSEPVCSPNTSTSSSSYLIGSCCTERTCPSAMFHLFRLRG